uniref:Uncharacterized protein n=1 Tax=Glossina austeni TaxID=7395 RepID=A0A1A9UVL0_GLOAU
MVGVTADLLHKQQQCSIIELWLLICCAETDVLNVRTPAFKNAMKMIAITLRELFASLEVHHRNHVLRRRSYQSRSVFELILDLYSFKPSADCYPVNSSSFTVETLGPKVYPTLVDPSSALPFVSGTASLKLNVYTGITFVINSIQAVLDKFYVRLIDLIRRNLIHGYVKRQSSSYHSSKHMGICVFTIEGVNDEQTNSSDRSDIVILCKPMPGSGNA